MACSSLADEALVIIEESKKDDNVDADGDGKADVKQIGNREYALRKTRLVMAKMNPTKVDSAVASIYNVWPSTFLIGVVFCFFGGLYPTLFAALQAAKHSGISVSRQNNSL